MSRRRRGRRQGGQGQAAAIPEGDPDAFFDEARRLLEEGRIEAAMEQTGFGLRLDLDRPDGYLILGELNMKAGDVVEARRNFRAAARCAGCSPDALLIGAIAAFLLDDLGAAGASARRAYVENVYLADALAGRPVPDYGLVHGIPEASRAHASALAARMAPVLTSEPEASRFLAGVAASEASRSERERLVGIARRLMREPRPAERAALQKDLDELRDPARYEDPGGGPSCGSFEV